MKGRGGEGGQGGGGKPGGKDGRWLEPPANEGEAELRHALDEWTAREPDEVALRRIWAKVADAPAMLATGGDPDGAAPARRSRWPWLAGATLLGAAAATAFLLLGTHMNQPNEPPARPNGPSAVVTPGTVRTGVGETLRLSLRGGAEATIAAESALVLADDGHPSVLSGEVSFRVPRQPAGRTFSVVAGVYRVQVVGTRFRVRVRAGATSAAAQVMVDEGTVEVWADRERLARIGAGRSWSSPASGPSASAEATPPPAPGPVVDEGALAAAVAAATPQDLQDLKAGAPGAAESHRRRRAPALSSTSLPASALRDPLADARAARAAGNLRRALALYRSIAERGGAAGENAEYEIGRVLRDGLHQPREAIGAWRAYRAQHPHGLLRIEADVSVVETLLAIDDKDGALAEAADFMRRHPDSERRPEMARLRRTLEADRQRH